MSAGWGADGHTVTYPHGERQGREIEGRWERGSVALSVIDNAANAITNDETSTVVEGVD